MGMGVWIGIWVWMGTWVWMGVWMGQRQHTNSSIPMFGVGIRVRRSLGIRVSPELRVTARVGARPVLVHAKEQFAFAAIPAGSESERESGTVPGSDTGLVGARSRLRVRLRARLRVRLRARRS